jgi:hypothetical protein
VAELSDKFLKQRINIKFCVKLGNKAKNLSLEMKHDIIPEGNDKFFSVNRQHDDSRKLVLGNDK